jgi:NADH-quinone oxidoreductase subunit N
MTFDPTDLSRSAPLLILSVSGILVLMLDAFSRVRLIGQKHHLRMPAETSEAYAVPVAGSRGYLMPITALLLLGALIAIVWQWGDAQPAGTYLYRHMLVLDRFGLFVSGVCVFSALLGVLQAPRYLREHKMEFGEYYALVLFSVAGMVILAQAADLVTVFLGVETLSLGVYVLTGSWRRSPRSSEAAMKYFLTGAFVSAILLYGVALIYGTAGTTDLSMINNRIGSLSGQPLFYVGMFLLLAGFAFKVAAVPFHMWAPDAYEGAPTPVTGFMMAAVKAAGFAGLVRVCVVALKGQEVSVGPTGWVQVLWVLSALTMTLGNIAALRQENIKRMLAYSSISHAGYLLLGVVALGVVGDDARGPLLFYMLAYAVTTVGAMGVVAWVGLGAGPDQERLRLSEWAGLGQRRPAAALAMTFFLLSLGGFPPTAGFFGKFYVFRAALMKPTLLPLVLLAIVNSVISVYYYLRVVTAMYFREPPADAGKVDAPADVGALSLSVLVAALLTLVLGVAPGWFSELAAAGTIGG